MSAPPVTIVVLTWRRLEETLECLESLRHVRYEPLRVLVVDNASGPDFVAAIRARFPEMEMLALDENLGYAGGNNVGMRHAIAAGAHYVLVLNNDTVMDPDCVKALVTAAEKDPRIAAVGARVMQYEHRDRVYCIGGHLTWLPPLIRLDGLNAGAAEVAQARDVEVVAGSSVLFRAGALRRIGFFDERFFAYHEDVDWCTRAREDGFRVTYAPDAMVLHRHAPGVGTPRAHPHLYYFYGRNAILYARKHATPAQWAKLLLLSAVWLLGSIPRRMLRGEPPGVVLRTAGFILLGMVDGLRNSEPRLRLLGLR